MEYLPYFGSLCFGVFVAYITWYFLKRISPKKFTFDGYKIIIANTVGVGGDGILGYLTDSLVAVWCYPIGLIIGSALYIIVAVIIFGEAPGNVAYGRISEEK